MLRPMPTIELNDMELIEAARGARCLKEMALADVRKQTNPGTREQFERSAEFDDAMARKFEQANLAIRT